jgi:hypothetical protein
MYIYYGNSGFKLSDTKFDIIYMRYKMYFRNIVNWECRKTCVIFYKTNMDLIGENFKVTF